MSFDDMDLNLLRVFDVMMRERSVTRAASELGRTQSAVSHSLSKLRYLLKDELFTRDGGEMRPTPRAVGADGVALGCAGMAEFASALQRKHDIPVVDGVGAAVGLAETLIRCGLAPSKRGVWAMPARAKGLDRFE